MHRLGRPYGSVARKADVTVTQGPFKKTVPSVKADSGKFVLRAQVNYEICGESVIIILGFPAVLLTFGSGRMLAVKKNRTVFFVTRFVTAGKSLGYRGQRLPPRNNFGCLKILGRLGFSQRRVGLNKLKLLYEPLRPAVPLALNADVARFYVALLAADLK